MANNKGKSSGDPITRWLVIGMVALVVVVGAGITIFNNTSKKAAVIPSAASEKDGYGIVFNADVPNVPTIDELNTAYQGLQNYKMISDNIILNSVIFKPLFGEKAAQELRATIKVIRAQGSTASTSEIKSSVVAAMNSYFSIDKWNFGDTFYFSELAAYLHRELGTIISSVVLVPLNSQKYFGDLYEIRSAPNEIFVNGATINNIEVIEALTSTNLRTAPGSGVI